MHYVAIVVQYNIRVTWRREDSNTQTHTHTHTVQGCTKGLHNPEKPPEPEKPVIKPLVEGEVSSTHLLVSKLICIYRYTENCM